MIIENNDLKKNRKKQQKQEKNFKTLYQRSAESWWKVKTSRQHFATSIEMLTNWIYKTVSSR